MEILIVFTVVPIFYLLMRFYLNKYKKIDMPLIPERYHDNLALTYIQMLIIMGGFILSFIVIKAIK